VFSSFFPKPRWFFISFVFWALACVLAWYLYAQDLGPSFSLGSLIGIHFPEVLAADADGGVKALFKSASEEAKNVWFYQYMFLAYLIFVVAWMLKAGNQWARWSVLGSALIVFVAWFQVQVSVTLNEWYGGFYDMIQRALSEPDKVSINDYYSQLSTVAVIIMVAVTVAVFNRFFVSHYVFRWRTAMNDYYTANWHRLRHIEGASQRIQEDTMRFAKTVESLGVSLLESVMTLLAFLPILWGLSSYVKVLPLVGEVPQALVFVAILWSVFGTGILALVGVRLPGLEFKNQRVEAAYRKELVYGEDAAHRAEPVTLRELFSAVRRNYFRLYFNYLYFDVVRYGYLNVGQFIPFIALAPSIVTGAFTLGIMQRILNAFNKVEDSFQYLVNSWTTIVELMSIYKRLRAFEAQLSGQQLPEIDCQYLAATGEVD
jgi:peptide/bleomycin uptake transporter